MNDDRLETAVSLARRAGRLAQAMRADPAMLDIRDKGPMDLVTAADLAVEDLLRKGLAEADPDASILGEEAGLSGDAKGAAWIVDPIDGTVNYARGMPDWAVSIAYSDGTALTHGVIHAPDLGLTAAGVRGVGAMLNGQPVRLPGAVASSPVVALGYSPRGPLTDYLDRIARLLDAGVEHRRHGAATIGFLGVLAGWFDAYYEPALNIWDAAAGLVLVEVAGGSVRHNPLPDFLERPSDILTERANPPRFETLLSR